ncbi:hypothetical protein J2W24_002282 [Variovorax boronicumulans]|uniref:WG repeat-containing protein n=1 Tax=Variovorax boronicumulans TaxID=436515 RepID=UPI002785A268|nr:WG repeat-containing protein [Variovorax boronicumulans]MDP9916635.1 hypothetical protein [Variovorax boronicumulans]
MLLIRSATSGLFGFIDLGGEVVVPPQFHDVGPFATNGLAVARLDLESETGLGFIDRTGRTVVGPSFHQAEDFSSQGIAKVILDREQLFQHGFVDAKGRKVFASVFEYARSFDDSGLAMIRTPEGTCGCIDVRGELVVPTLYDGIGAFAVNGLAKARRADFTGFIDVTGKEVLRPAFKTFGEFDACGLATFKGGNHRHGYMDASGEPRIPARYVEASGFARNGLAKVRIGEKWGFIDTAGNVAIEPVFDDLSSFCYAGFAVFLHTNNKWGCIDATGDVVIDPVYDDIDLSFDPQVLEVVRDGVRGYITKAGTWIGNYLR